MLAIARSTACSCGWRPPPPPPPPPRPRGWGTNPPPETCGTTGWETVTNPMLEAPCATAGGVLVRKCLRTGITMVLLFLLRDRKLKLLAEHHGKVLESELEQVLCEPRPPLLAKPSSQPELRKAG